MTQILLYGSKNGIALATDSRAVLFDSEKEDGARHFEVQKLFPLGRDVVVVTGGAGFGVFLCREFQKHVSQAGLHEFGGVADAARAFFRSEVESFRQKSSGSIRPDLDRVYFLIAGHIPDGGEEPFRFLLLASENGADPVHAVETTNVLAIPRQMGIEHRLGRLFPPDGSIDEVEALFESFLMKLADSGDDVGAPFHFVRITSDGVKVRTSRPPVRASSPD